MKNHSNILYPRISAEWNVKTQAESTIHLIPIYNKSVEGKADIHPYFCLKHESMQRIPTLLQKLNELAQNGEQTDIIELDLMMDYTRVLYADLLEWRKRLQFNTSLVGDIPATQVVPATKAPPYEAPPAPLPAEETKPVKQDEINTTEPVVEQSATITEKKPRKDGDINKLIGINDKYQFMSELFSNNREVYNQAIEEINGMDSYEEAVNWLEFNVGERYNWQKEEETVVAFYDVLKTFFSSR